MTATETWRDRQRRWERAYRFRLWDAQDGPTRFQRWYYEHPTAAALGVVALTAGIVLVFSLLSGSGGSGRFPSYGIIVAVLARWNLPIIRELHDEWRASRPTEDHADADEDADRDRPGRKGWLQRSDERHQAMADTERELGSALDQPAARLVGVVYAVQFVVAFGVVLVIELVRWLTG